MGTEMALGRGIPTVALFPAGAENFASIGAARERETSTPGYRPGLRGRGGQQGSLVPSTSPPCLHSAPHSLHTIPVVHTDPLLAHTSPPVHCTAPFPPRATATSCPAGQPALSLDMLASQLQYPHSPLCSAVHLSLGLDLPSWCPSWVLLGVLEHRDTCPCAHSLPLACTSPSSAPPVQVLYNTAVLHSTPVVDKARILRQGITKSCPPPGRMWQGHFTITQNFPFQES